jgi:hypothetical protein
MLASCLTLQFKEIKNRRWPRALLACTIPKHRRGIRCALERQIRTRHPEETSDRFSEGSLLDAA